MEKEEEKYQLIQNIYNRYFEKAFVLRDIFVDYYTEERVDLNIMSIKDFSEYSFNSLNEISTGKLINLSIDSLKETDNVIEKLHQSSELPTFNILIWFPHVTITNEEGQSVNIEDLYARLQIGSKRLDLYDVSMLRSSYSYLQWLVGYSHSHLPHVGNEIIWKHPCFGSGPIVETYNSLLYSNTSDTERKELYGLFAFELDKYVTVESIAGGPYFKMSCIKLNNTSNDYTNLPTFNIDSKYIKLATDFLKYYINNYNIKFSLKNNQLCLGMGTSEFKEILYKEFAKWYNNQYCKGVYNYTKMHLINIDIITENSNNSLYKSKIEYLKSDHIILKFKNRDIHFRVYGNDANIEDLLKNSITFNSNFYKFLLLQLYTLINFNNDGTRSKKANKKYKNSTEHIYLL